MTTSLAKAAVAARPAAQYTVSVQRARTFLRFLLALMVLAGVATTVVSFFAVNDTLARYRQIVADSAVSADAAQAARSALLKHHSSAATFLSQGGTAEAGTELARVEQEWESYQEELRRVWGNRSDTQFGEFTAFEAADRATWRYRAAIDAMAAFAALGNSDAAKGAFLESHRTLVQEVLPALNGLESVKLESMEAAYATTNAAISSWQETLLLIGGIAVGVLIVSFLLTRFWLHYAWTWELLLAALVALGLFVWFNVTLLYAANQVEVLVRDAYDTIAGVQSVEALLTQAEAMESMAIFTAGEDEAFQEEATRRLGEEPEFLEDADQYLFLMEQQLCGDRGCTNTPFVEPGTSVAVLGISEAAAEAAANGQSKYGLPRPPLVLNASTNDFEGEAEALEALRVAIQGYRQANMRLAQELAGGASASLEQRDSSANSYNAALDAIATEQDIVRAAFNGIYATVTDAMEVNRWLTLLFTALALLGFWGLRRRRDALFA